MTIQAPAVCSQLKVGIFEREKVLLVTLNRPEKFNAVTLQMTRDMDRLLDWFEAEPSLWVLIITGTGRGFCGGLDLLSFVNPDGSTEKLVKWSPNGFAGVSLRRFIKPVICALNGGTYGGGAELAMNADVIIAAEGVSFAFPEPLRGAHAGVGGIPNAFYRSPQLVPYLLSGKPIPPRLLELHVFTEVVPLKELLPAAFRWAADFVQASPEAVHLTKEFVNRVRIDGCGVQEACDRNESSQLLEDYRDSENNAEGLLAFEEASTLICTKLVTNLASETGGIMEESGS